MTLAYAQYRGWTLSLWVKAMFCVGVAYYHNQDGTESMTMFCGPAAFELCWDTKIPTVKE